MIKPKLRILGIDDGPKLGKLVPVVGVISRGATCMDGMLLTRVENDGMDATDKLITLINSSRHKPQLRVIMLDGITLAGFNLVDIEKLFKETGKPIIVVNRKLPDLEKIRNSLKKFRDFKARLACLEAAGPLFEFKEKKLYYQAKGLEKEEVEEILRLACIQGNYPEPLRLAHLIATTISLGESRGRP